MSEGDLGRESEAAYTSGTLLEHFSAEIVGKNCIVLIMKTNTYKRREIS